jgi:ATP-binding cassette subfamily B protein
MLKRFLHYYKPYKGLLFMDLMTAIISSALSIFFPALTRELIKTYIPQRMWVQTVTLFAFMLGIYLAQALITFIRIKWGHIMGVKMETDMRSDLFTHLQSLSFGYYDHNKTGAMMSRMTNDLFQIAELAHHGPEDFLISAFTLIGAYIVMFGYNTSLSFISMIPIPFMLVVGIVQGGRMKEKNRDTRDKLADVNSSVENSIQGIREVKSFTSESFQAEKFGKSNAYLKKSKSAQYAVMAAYHANIGLQRNFFYFFTVVGGAVLMYYNRLEAYDLVAFLLYINVITTPVDKLITFVEELATGSAAFERFIEVMDSKADIVDALDARPLKVTNASIEYRNVSFSYQSDEEQVLGNVSLVIPGSTTLAVVGESGAGKTTLVSLLPRFYEKTSGEILIDGQSITEVTQKSLRENIGLVRQDVFLFDDSIRENLRYGKADATEEQMLEALELANLGPFIRSLPNGLDTQVGEHGTRLSGGQKQRLSIARVFLKNPPILIMDEATSSLDTESEAQIQEAFDRLSRGRTAIIIAHRLSTVINADNILVMQSGHVVEQGSHEQLLQAHGVYWRLYSRQSQSLIVE